MLGEGPRFCRRLRALEQLCDQVAEQMLCLELNKVRALRQNAISAGKLKSLLSTIKSTFEILISRQKKPEVESGQAVKKDKNERELRAISSGDSVNLHRHSSVTKIHVSVCIDRQRARLPEISKLYLDCTQHGMRVIFVVRWSGTQQMVGGERVPVEYVHGPKICGWGEDKDIRAQSRGYQTSPSPLWDVSLHEWQ